MSFVISVPDALRQAVEAQSGGLVTVLYDDKGYPSFMRVIPKFRYEDLGFDAQLGTGVCTAFLVGGVEKPYIMVGQYLASVHDGRAVSLPGVDPKTSVNFDSARSYCTAKGTGWHLMTVHEWAAVALWCMANGFEPRGNTNYGRSHASTHEVARRVDGGQPGDTTGTPRTLTGTGPVTWRHDNSPIGIADLVGNTWEWQDGFKLVDGRIYCTTDNDYALAETGWSAQNAYFDSPVAGDGVGTDNLGAPTLAASITNYAGPVGNDGAYDYNYISPWSSLGLDAGYTSIQLLKRLLVEPAGIAPQGAFWVRNYGTRLPFRGGNWSLGANAGLAAMNLSNARSNANSNIGFRPAFAA